MGHRGSPEDAAENTLSSFRLALEQGADVLETDLRFTRDNEIVLIHDATVDRTTFGSGSVSEMSLSDIKELRTRMPLSRGANNRPSTAGDSPPSLQELLDVVGGETSLALELKDDRFLDPTDAGRLIDLLEKYHALESTVLVSFSLARLTTFRSIAPRLSLGMITMSNPLPLFQTEFLGPFFPILLANPIYVLWARRLGRIVCPLDPSPEPRIGYYRRLGVSVLLTNHPGRTVKALEQSYAR